MTSTLTAVQAACTAQASTSSPLGPILLARTANGLAGAWFAYQKHHPGALDAPEVPDDPLLADAADQLRAYFAGRAIAFDLPLDLQGTPFQRSVWQALLGIAPGHTRSYGAIAAAIGAASAVRAVGGAVGRNPVSVIVPCHRVIGRDGALTGYAGGLERKRVLLALEASSRVKSALTCSARIGLQADAVRWARRMRLESPISPPTLSRGYAGEGAASSASRARADEGTASPPSPARADKGTASSPSPARGRGLG
jgi:methylated-DNA-[protein]-cysteine S-methyltransferase